MITQVSDKKVIKAAREIIRMQKMLGEVLLIVRMWMRKYFDFNFSFRD